jgi:predicted transcriptional regulator
MDEMIRISKGFQTSVNIAFDLNNDDKVRGFIPTQSSLDIIEDVLLSTAPSSTQRARILIGAYGRGKSQIILVLLSLLFKKNVDLFDKLLNKMKIYNPLLHEYTLNYLKSDQKILPIIVRGSSTSLTQSFLSALQQSLNQENLSDLMPETHFKAAINQIINWKNNYVSTYEKFISSISKSSIDFIVSLEEYDVNVYEEFIQLYPNLTAGSVFNPFLGFDIVDLYQNITVKLREKGYSGVYVVYDEFSKYLESSISTSTNSDIKLLQDFAEKCNRSGYTQMHLMLISHKDISNYIDSNLPKDKVDGWRGVSGRFNHINLHNNYSQIYEIITSVIHKEKISWDLFKKKYQIRFEHLKDSYVKNGLLNKLNKEEIENATEGCYPLHPISTFILPRLSEKVAQNERTLFTFLSSEENFTLRAFLNQQQEEFWLLTPDYIYDYFEPLFRKEPYTSEVYKMYKLTASVLRRVEINSLQSKIIKTISLIYLVEQFEKLAPVVDVIVDTFRETVNDPKVIHEALNELVEKECIVYLKRSNHYLKMKETSGENIKDEIEKYIQKRLTDVRVADILNNTVFDSFMYPTAYNDDNDIIRYFDFKFIDSDYYWQIAKSNEDITISKADGIVFAIVPRDQSEIEILRKDILNSKKNNNRLIFVLPKKYKDIKKDVLDYAAVTALRTEAKGDEILCDEYDIYIEDLSEVVGKYHGDFVRPENDNAVYYYHGEQYNFRRKAQLSGLLSEICKKIYYRTPIINNESINKNELPTVAINSRTKIITGLLANELEPNIGLTGTGQDVSMMRSTLIKTGILKNVDTNPTIELNPPDDRIAGMLSEIKTFFSVNATKKVGAEFSSLYNILTSPENGLGLKRGLIPIFIAVVLHLYKKNLVILYGGNEVKITPDLINDINESPINYTVILEDWNEEKAQYMDKLEELFSDFVKEHEKTYNTFTYILHAMNYWYLSLPKYAKEMTVTYGDKGISHNVDVARRKFVNSLKQLDVNPREFLFERVFAIYGMKEFNVNIIDNIIATKNMFDSAVPSLIQALNFYVKELFNTRRINSSLTSIIKDWYESLGELTRQNLFSGNENRILELIANVTHDENSFIQRLAKTVTFLRVEDWNNDTMGSFLIELKDFKKTIEDFDSKKESGVDNATSYEIVFTDVNGNKIPKRFDKINYSNRAKLLLNEMATHLDEYGQSISDQEKRQVLIELLENLC